MSFNIAAIRKLSGLTEVEATLLADMKPILEKHSDEIVTAFYKNLDQRPELSNLLDAVPERRTKLKAHLKTWILSLATGTYDTAYKEHRYTIGQRHVEAGIDPRWVIGAMSFCRGCVLPIVDTEYAGAPDRTSRYLALDKVMDLDLNIMLQSYDDRRMDVFLETTGFSKALFESMISTSTAD